MTDKQIINSDTKKLREESLLKTAREISDYKYALDQSSIVAITDQKGIITFVNHNFCKISKYSADELIGQDHRIINSGHHPKTFFKELWTSIANGQVWKGEIKNKAKDGIFYWVSATIIPFLNEKGKPYQYLSIRTDIADRKRAEDELLNSRKEMQELARHLQTIREEERASIAREIHDDLGQLLTALKIDISLIGSKVSKTDREVHSRIKAATDLVDATMQTIRRLASSLRPAILDEFGLAAALEWQSKKFTELTNIESSFFCNDPERSIDNDRSIALFRIYQESLNNITKHSKATAVHTSFLVNDNDKEAILSIKDNGIGFDAEEVKSKQRFGLMGMHERIKILDGKFIVNTAVGKGTQIAVHVTL